MPDLSSPVEFSFVLATIGIITVITIVGIVLIKLKKV